jgi:hypothetical protein
MTANRVSPIPAKTVSRAAQESGKIEIWEGKGI